MLAKYDMIPLEVFEAVQTSNMNVGGDVIEKNSQSYVVRGIGLLTKPEDIGNIIVKDINNVPVLVRNVAQVKESNAPRVGQPDWMTRATWSKASSSCARVKTPPKCWAA
jgi:cobalt-zinc-cadmium resistance protein CzcA